MLASNRLEFAKSVQYPSGKFENECEKYIRKKHDTTKADTLGAHMKESWVHGVETARRERAGFPPVTVAEPWPHEAEGVDIPMPTESQLEKMRREFYQRVRGQEIGPHTTEWRDAAFAWARKLRVRFFGNSKQVTGLWSQAAHRFRKRLQYLEDRELADTVMREVTHGVRLPFGEVPASPIFAKVNHSDLPLRAGQVYKALCTQLEEGSVQAFNMVEGDKPMCIMSLRWVEKSNTDEVRLTLNGRPLNPVFPPSECTIELETHRELRSEYESGQVYLGFDLHNGFFNQQYEEKYRKWVCFRVHESELLPCHVAELRRRFPTSWVDRYMYWNYRGLVMGLSPSCQQLQRVNLTMLKVWRRFPVQDAVWDGTSYIDDLMAWLRGRYKAALELALRLLAEQVVLGFSVNLNYKSDIVPSTYYNHIGIVIDSARMRFSLPASRVEKMALTAKALTVATKVGERVSAKLVARFVGQLWSASIVCHRAVAIMARGIIRTLATMINTSEAMDETNPNRLRYILKRIWGGDVVWTQEAQQDLSFWRTVDFASLSAPISHDAWRKNLEQWVLHPTTGKIAKDVKVFAVDTSDSMSGGGEFFRDGGLWKMRNGMAVRLTPEEVLTSSTFRELLGVLRMDLAIVPNECRKLVVVLDSLAAVFCLLHGSKVESLQRLVRKIYKRCLKYNRVLWPVWLRRTMDLIEQVDRRSRLVDRHAFATEPATFWRSNDIARSLWGRGFQMDVCADMHNVQPADCNEKLPFFSRWPSPYASATDMLQQDWRGRVNWCNPPFALLPRVFALLRAQQACAAVLALYDSTARWFHTLRLHARNVLHVERFAIAGKKMAVFFVDFAASPPSKAFVNRICAESLRVRGTRARTYHTWTLPSRVR